MSLPQFQKTHRESFGTRMRFEGCLMNFMELKMHSLHQNDCSSRIELNENFVEDPSVIFNRQTSWMMIFLDKKC